MINGLLELTDSLGMDYYFVTVTTEKNTLIIRPFNNYCKVLNKTVQLADIKGLICCRSQGVLQVSFDYQREHYAFADYGNKLIQYLKQELSIEQQPQTSH